jgi:hypothetical protein
MSLLSLSLSRKRSQFETVSFPGGSTILLLHSLSQTTCVGTSKPSECKLSLPYEMKESSIHLMFSFMERSYTCTFTLYGSTMVAVIGLSEMESSGSNPLGSHFLCPLS